MRVGVGYSDMPDTLGAGRQAALEALRQGAEKGDCDLVLLFATARHDAILLRSAVSSVLGEDVRIVGGGAAGVISNDAFGYAGDQVGVVAFWLSSVRCDVFAEGGLNLGEMEVGRRLGKDLLDVGTTADSSILLFYDALDQTHEKMRLIMGTPLLAGMEESMGVLPNISGAGLQGDFIGTPTKQWTGAGIAEHTALALHFSGAIKIDSVIMHGCYPATDYYTVTKADEQTILEINGQPALQFMENLLGPSLTVEQYPFFLILGVNRGEKWREFDETSYVNRLCLGIDKERGGLVMFEPDMVEGTEFQIMFRSAHDLEYMTPKIESLFKNAENRNPVFALYINCAGRAAGFSGLDQEDALIVQKTVAGRVPLLGIYTGVEVASVEGRPRALDWTGILCLFSVTI